MSFNLKYNTKINYNENGQRVCEKNITEIAEKNIKKHIKKLKYKFLYCI